MASMRTSVVAVAMIFAVAAAAGASYTVGEPGGSWDLQTNYTTWASSISFHLGDQLVFKYSSAAHDVVEVTNEGYLSCSPSDPIAARRTGQDTVQLDRPGRRYFICGVPGHCDAGMKLQVRVVCPSPPVVNGAPGVNGTPGGVCLDGSPTTITTTGSTSYNSAPGCSVTSALVMAAAMLLLLGLVA